MYLQRILFILIIKVAFIGCTYTSTVCYGSVPSCTTHKLSCTSPLVIQIINTSYGYRPGCDNLIGISKCTNTTCCKEKCGDCFLPFTSKDKTRVEKMCSGEQSCNIPGFRDVSGRECGGTIDRAYSKILYDCVTNVTIKSATKAPQSSTSVEGCVTDGSLPSSDTDDVTGVVVGGIFGAIIIIVIIIVVIVILYKRKTHINKEMTPSAATPQYYVIEGPGTINNRKDTSGYDEIELDSKPRVQATSTHLNQSTINNHNETSGYDEIELDSISRVPTTDNYDHVGDDKLGIKPSKQLDNYNHIGTHDHSVHEDDYNHIGDNLSPCSHHLEADYNHINGVRGTFNDEDDYNHIGDNDNKNVIKDDNYHHIGSGDIEVEGEYIHSADHDSHINYDNRGNNRGQDDSEAPYKLAFC